MLRLTITRDKYESHTSEGLTKQSIFDIVYNITGDHELALISYGKSTHMKLGDVEELSNKAYKVKIEFYREITVLNISDAKRQITIAMKNKFNTYVWLYHKEPWILEAQYNMKTNKIGYRAEYNYKNGDKGSINMIIQDGELIKSREDIKIPKDVINKIWSLHRAIYN